MQEGLHALIFETESRGPLLGDDPRALNGLKTALTDRAVVADSLDVEQTSIGLEAYFPQGEEVLEPFPDPKIPGVVDGGFGAQSSAFLVVLLDPTVLVVDVE